LIPHPPESIVDTEQEKQSQITDLPDPKKAHSDKVAADVAEKVKGGKMVRGSDDDLDDLEVERFK
jgi:hypothetical protein